jgi:excisionase family DNA binding protein
MFEVNPNAFYTLADLSVGLNITLASLRSWIRQDKLKASKVGRTYMVSGQDLKYFLENGIKSNP